MIERKKSILPIVTIIFMYSAVLLAFQYLALPVYSDTARWLAWVLFVLGSWPMFHFLRSPSGLPFLELVLLNYVLFFALPLFYQEELSIYIGTVIPQSSSIELTLFCAIIGVVMLQLGFGFFKKFLKGKHLPQLRFSSNEQRLFLFAVVTLIVRSVIDLNLLPTPPELYRVVRVIFSSDLGIALLSVLYYRKCLTRKQNIIALVLLVSQLFIGLSTGMSQALLQPILIWYLCRWFVNKVVPYRTLAILVIIFILLQPVKSNYRQEVWFSNKNFSPIEKIEVYSNLFWSHWLKREDLQKKIAETTGERLSLLLQTAHVIERTPSMVPYKNGETFMYMVYTWVPRFIWHNKPIAQQANIDFSRDYGIQNPDTFNTTMFGIGHLGEAYINFGLIGIFVIFFFLGGFYCLPLVIIPVNAEAIAALAILSAVLVNFIFIGSTIGDVFGSIIQQIIVQSLLIKFFCERKVSLRKLYS